MIVFDTHAHLNDSTYEKDRGEVIKRSLRNNIWVMNVGSDEKTSAWAVKLADENKEGVFAAVGVHPHNAGEKFNPDIFRGFLKNPKVLATGEMGLDFHRLPDNKNREAIKEKQKEVFKKQIELALEFDKPIIIHCDKAHDEVLDILNPYALNLSARGGSASGGKSKLRGVVHSFLGNYKQARRYRETGFKISVNGIITYARDYDKVILDTPMEDILIETDCPYLAPVPYRGERNEPIYILEVAKKLAEIKSLALEEVLRRTTENARELFSV